MRKGIINIYIIRDIIRGFVEIIFPVLTNSLLDPARIGRCKISPL